MNPPILPLRPGDDAPIEPALPLPAPEPASEAADEWWPALLRVSNELHRPGSPGHGLELRHVRRVVQPLAEAMLAGERVASALVHAEPGESAATRAAHTAVAAVCLAGPLRLPRADAADVGVVALLHDAGRDANADHSPARATDGVRRLLGATTWSPLSVSVVQASRLPAADRDAPLVAQVVWAAAAYVSLLTRQDSQPWVSPAGALARVLGASRDRRHPAIPPALVRALGLYPPGQVVQLDDGSFARALAPDAHDPARPWISRLVDARGLPVPAWAGTATPLPPRRRVVRALPRQEWPEVEQARPAA